MKKNVTLVFAILLLIALVSCNTNIGDEFMNTEELSTTYVYGEGTYPDKNWPENTTAGEQTAPSPGGDTKMDKDAAIALALEEFEKIKQSGICQSYVLKGVFYDIEDSMWIVYFGEDTEIPGSCYNIAISKTSGKVVNMWPSE